MNNDEQLENKLTNAFTTSLIRFSVLAFIAFVCTWAFTPFLPILLWALVLAIALYPIRLFFDAKFKWSIARSSTVITLLGVLLLGLPTAMVGNSIASKTFETYQAYTDGKLEIPKPTKDVEQWPVVGEKLYIIWSDASNNLEKFVVNQKPQIESIANRLFEMASNTFSTIFLLIGAIIIAGIMLAWAEPATKSMRRIFISFSDVKGGTELHALTTATIRQVAVGIIGIAFLTAIVFGITVAFSGLPAAALFTIVALLFAIMQLPVTIVALVAVGLLWSGNNDAVIHNSIFTVLIIAASLIDNVLKPMILGRGLDVPMPIVLVGALGGMMSGGILGMFIGASFLAAGYQVFMKWVDKQNQTAQDKANASTD